MKFTLTERRQDIPFDIDLLYQFLNEADYSEDSSVTLKSVQEFKDSMEGTCWDFVNFAANYLDSRGIDFHTYFIQIDNGQECPTHTFIIIPESNNAYWVENAWIQHKGIHTFNSVDEAVREISRLFIEEYGTDMNNEYEIYKYDTLPLKEGGLEGDEFLDYVYENGMLWSGEEE